MVAAASAEAVAFTAAASVGVVFEVEAFTAVLPVEAFAVEAFAEVALAIIPMVTDTATLAILIVTDTAALVALAILMVTATAALAAAASVAAAFMAVAFAAVGDPYNQSVSQGSAGYTDEEKLVHQSVFQKLGNKIGGALVVLNECDRA